LDGCGAGIQGEAELALEDLTLVRFWCHAEFLMRQRYGDGQFRDALGKYSKVDCLNAPGEKERRSYIQAQQLAAVGKLHGRGSIGYTNQ